MFRFTVCFFSYNVFVGHFSSPVIIRSKKGLILFRASIDVHMTTWSLKFFSLNLWYLARIFPHNSKAPNMAQNDLLSWIKPFCNLQYSQKLSWSNMTISLKFKSPFLNFLNYLLHVLFETVPSPNTFIQCHVCLHEQNLPVDLIFTWL